jgi:hypothetical protein
VDLFPLSFIGVGLAQQNIYSNFDQFGFFDCEGQVRCRGDITRQKIKAQMALAYQGFFTSAKNYWARTGYGQKRFHQGQVQRPGEFRFVVLADPEGEYLSYGQYVLGFKHNNFVYALVSEKAYFSTSKSFQHMDLLVVRKISHEHEYTLGAGVFESSHARQGAVIVFQYHFKMIPGLKLF